MKSLRLFVFLLLQFSLMTSFANNPGVSYQGRIFKPDGNPLEGSSVQFRLQVRSPGSENCLLYEEVQTLNMAGSSGVFALTLNDGTGTRLDTATYQVDRIFANRETMTLDTTRCAAGTTYTPNSSDGRKLVVYFKDETMAAYEAMPLMNLNYVPQAMYALEAQKVDKFEVSNILRAVDGSGNPATAPALNPTQLTNLNTLLATPAANYVQTTSNGSVALPVVAGNPSSGLAAGQIWYDSGSNVMKYYDGAVKTFGTSGGGVTSVATGTGLTGGPITTTGTINVDVGVTTGKIIQVAASNKLPVIDGSNLTNITATDATKLPLAGGTMTGPLVNNSNSVSTALAVTQAGSGYAASFMGGNVGIGTAAPGAKLEVNGATKFRGDNVAWTFGDDGSFPGQLGIIKKVGSGPFFGSANANPIRFGFSDYSDLYMTSIGSQVFSEKMRIDTSGNVGIGTTSPGTILDVAGAQTFREIAAPAVAALDQGRIYFDSTANKFKVSENNGAYVDLISAGGIGDFKADGTIPMTGNINLGANNIVNSNTIQGSGAATFNIKSPDVSTGVAGRIDVVGANNSDGDGGSIFITAGSADGGTVEGGWVNVTSGANFSDSFSGASGGIQLSTPNSGSTTSSGSIILKTGSAGIGTVGTISLATSNTTRLTVHGNGNVGVGTTNPSARLHVSPTAAATGTLTAARVTGAANWNQTLSTEIPDLDINLARTVQWATGALPMQRAVKVQPPTLGFVGASTVTDAATLGITGAPVKGTNATVTNTHGLLISSGAVSTATNSYGLSVNAQSGATNNYAAQFIGGNVGIGTTNPSEKLEVSGNVKATGLCIGADCRTTWPASSNSVTISEKSANFTITTSDSGTLFVVTGSTALINIPTPAAAGAGFKIAIKSYSSSTMIINSATADCVTTPGLFDKGYLELVSTGTQWIQTVAQVVGCIP
ncbi:MAG: hypothetical protein J0M15_11795 [Deltaproteobacteria bacterium]|nr:hypothetical protein [Deltaproteobacteria bacterium]